MLMPPLAAAPARKPRGLFGPDLPSPRPNGHADALWFRSEVPQSLAGNPLRWFKLQEVASPCATLSCAS